MFFGRILPCKASADVIDETTTQLRTPIKKLPGDPALQKAILDAVRTLSGVAATCLICNRNVDPSEKRATLIHSEENVAVYHETCFKKKNALPLQPAQGWQSKVTPQHLEVVERYDKGETQREIGEALGLNQKKISRMLAQVKAARKTA